MILCDGGVPVGVRVAVGVCVAMEVPVDIVVGARVCVGVKVPPAMIIGRKPDGLISCGFWVWYNSVMWLWI
jgi:hypothetical protein